MWQLLQDDQPLIQAADPDAADGGSGATDDSGTTSPDATTPGATDDGSGATDDGTGATDDGTGSTDAPVTTPTFDGQTADQQTCSNTDTLF
jgi:septum site-determining protein MinD